MTISLIKLTLKHGWLLGAIMALTACNQVTSNQSDTASSVVSTTNDPHAGHDMNPMPTASSANHVSEYQHAMTAMHEQMMVASNIANPDVAFAKGMIPHHQGAIEMAKIQLKYGKDNEMRQLAQTIINAQQTEITQMQTWLEQHQSDTTTTTTPASDMNMDMTTHDRMMQGITNTDPDVAFAEGMIPHHQGAIEMADTQLRLGKDPAMLALAKKIKAAQDPEIKQMQDWLKNQGTQ